MKITLTFKVTSGKVSERDQIQPRFFTLVNKSFFTLYTQPAETAIPSNNMIRSNPTAIPLRASDLKHLQAEIDKRKLEREQSQVSPSGQAVASRDGAGSNEGSRDDGNGEERRDERRERHQRIGL